MLENVQKAFEIKGDGFIRKCNNFSNGRFVDIPTAFVHIEWIKEARRYHCECLLGKRAHKKFILLPLLYRLCLIKVGGLYSDLKCMHAALTEVIKNLFQCTHYYYEKWIMK